MKALHRRFCAMRNRFLSQAVATCRPGIDRLEERVLFTTAFPTAQEQYMLQIMNRARANPNGEVALDANSTIWAGTPDLNEGLPAGTITADAKQPLAFDPNLESSAEGHSAYMLSSGNLSHDEPTPATADPTTRGVTAGYVFSPNAIQYIGENIAYQQGVTTDPQGQADVMEQQLFIDPLDPSTLAPGDSPRGHRLQLLNNYSNLAGVGISVSTDGTTSYATQDYVHDSNVYLCGVAYNDANSNNFYDVGEGLGGVTITATSVADTTQVFTTTTWAAGGYTLQLPAGAYTVTASGGGIGTPATQTVTLAASNVESDFLQTATVQPPPATAAPTILVQPTSQSSNFAGQPTGAPVTFTVAASGTPAPTIQWQVSSNGGAYASIAGATSGNYTFTPTTDQNGNQYEAVITNSQGSITSNPATLTIQGVETTITTRLPATQTVNVGDTVTLTSAGIGLNNVIAWASLQPGPGANYTTIAGATGPVYSFVVTPDMAGKEFFYQVTYTNSQSTYFTDQSVSIITVNATATAPSVIAQPSQDPATAGSTATFVTADSAYPVATVQWQVSNSKNGTYTDVSGGTSETLTIPVTSANNGQYYRAVFTNNVGTTTSQATKLAVNSKPVLNNEVATLAEQAAAALAAINTCAKVTVADGVTLTQDLKRLKSSKADLALVSSLEKTDAKNRQTLRTHEAKSLNAIKHDAATVLSESTALTKHAGNATLESKLSAALAKLQSDANANTVPSDASNCHLGVVGALAPIAAANTSDPKLQEDVGAAASESDNIGQILGAPMTTVLQIVSQVETSAQS